MRKAFGRRFRGAVCAMVLVASAMAFAALVTEPGAATDAAALKGGYRRPAKNGWTYVHLQGTPRQVGYQNGYLLAPEIDDTLKMFQLELTHDNKTVSYTHLWRGPRCRPWRRARSGCR